jgi:hypothetical protein
MDNKEGSFIVYLATSEFTVTDSVIDCRTLPEVEGRVSTVICL